MRRYEFGGTAPLRYEVRDADGELASATVVLTVTSPAAVVSTPTVTATSLGIYDAVVPADEYGPWRYQWVASGALDDVDSGQFYVADAERDLPPLASFERLVSKLGYTPVDGERTRAEGLLVEASGLIRDVAEKTWTDETSGALVDVPIRVANICVAAAFRAFGNPEALTQRAIGDSSKSFDRAGREGGEDVYLTDAEEAAIRKAAAASSFIAVTLVSPYNGTYLDDDGELVWA